MTVYSTIFDFIVNKRGLRSSHSITIRVSVTGTFRLIDFAFEKRFERQFSLSSISSLATFIVLLEIQTFLISVMQLKFLNKSSYDKKKSIVEGESDKSCRFASSNKNNERI